MEQIKILVVDDHPVVRSGLQSLLSQYPEFMVVGTSDGSAELLPLIEETNPHVILLDIRLKDRNGLDIAGQLARRELPCRIIILSSYDDDAYLTQAAKAGVWGYLLKSSSPEVLADAIKDVHRGKKCLSPDLAGKALEQLEKVNKEWVQAKSGMNEEDLKLLELIANGNSVQEIAEILYLSERSVKRRTQAIIEKLGATNRTQAVAEAFRLGLL